MLQVGGTSPPPGGTTPDGLIILGEFSHASPDAKPPVSRRDFLARSASIGGAVLPTIMAGRGGCPSCNGRHMAQTAARLADHVIPPVPVRQGVISVHRHVSRGIHPLRVATRKTRTAALRNGNSRNRR
jgi:hypothetical protein